MILKILIFFHFFVDVSARLWRGTRNLDRVNESIIRIEFPSEVYILLMKKYIEDNLNHEKKTTVAPLRRGSSI